MLKVLYLNETEKLVCRKKFYKKTIEKEMKNGSIIFRDLRV